MTGKRERVLVLGGGLGGISAALALTAPEQQGRYDVTVHTMGWRLGGKGASGRDPENANRVLEHGLHIWFGCYDNAFKMMREIYDEVARPPEAPLATLDQAFRPQDHFTLYERVEGAWRRWEFDFPRNDLPEGGHPSTLGFVEIIMAWVRRALKEAGLAEEIEEGFGAVIEEVGEGLLHAAEAGVSSLLEEASSFLRGLFGHTPADAAPNHDINILAQNLHNAIRAHHATGGSSGSIAGEAIAAGLKVLAEAIWDDLSPRIPGDDLARRSWIFSYLGITICRGILLDDLHANGVDSINGIEGRDWLHRHACFADDTDKNPNGLAFDAPMIRALYDAAFAYRDGRADQPDFSAATLLRACLWLPFSYKGAFCYEMQAGMGDTVFTPAYQALLGRGVRFEFFSQVSGVEADATGTKVAKVRLERQVKLRSPRYRPLVKVKDLLCWPADPLFDQIEDGPALKAAGVNLEHYDSGWQNTGGVSELEAGRDFDHVVFAVPLPAHMRVCPDLVNSIPAWKSAVENVKATRTCAAQLWMSPTRQELGVTTAPSVMGSYVEPWSSLSDFSHILLREEWGDADVNSLVYTCGVFPYDVAATEAEALEWTKASITGFLEKHAAVLWPASAGADGYDWSVLYDRSGAQGRARLDAQYLRANVDVQELYVLSTHEGIGHRPKTAAAGLENLVFAGDWTDNGFNISAVEGAVMSGLQASRAISGWPKDIVGENPKALSPSD